MGQEIDEILLFPLFLSNFTFLLTQTQKT